LSAADDERKLLGEARKEVENLPWFLQKDTVLRCDKHKVRCDKYNIRCDKNLRQHQKKSKNIQCQREVPRKEI
jgi:hypothetical protein